MRLVKFKNESPCFRIMPDGFIDYIGSEVNDGFMGIIIILTPESYHHELQDSQMDQEPLDLLKSDLSGLSYGLFSVTLN